MRRRRLIRASVPMSADHQTLGSRCRHHGRAIRTLILFASARKKDRLENRVDELVRGRDTTKHDGSFPAAPLLFINGNYNVVYGTTQNGGTGKCLSKLGCGTVFSIELSQARRIHD